MGMRQLTDDQFQYNPSQIFRQLETIDLFFAEKEKKKGTELFCNTFKQINLLISKWKTGIEFLCCRASSCISAGVNPVQEGRPVTG